MPILVSPAPNLNLPSTVCDYVNPENNLMEEQAMESVQDLITAIANYEDLFQNELPAYAEEMIYFSNFRKQDLKALIDENADCNFIRIYHARNVDGYQFTIAVPVLGRPDGVVKQTADVKYVVNCCACRPNCPGNHGF